MSQPTAQRAPTGTVRRIIVLGAALGLYLALDALKIRSLGAVDSLTLASVGFVILASYSVGALLIKLGASRVTGYILAGILLGPSAFEILSTRTVAEMSVFNGLALGLIALSAGLELHISSIRRLTGTLVRARWAWRCKSSRVRGPFAIAGSAAATTVWTLPGSAATSATS